MLPGGSERARRVTRWSSELALDQNGHVLEPDAVGPGWAPPEDAELVHFLRPGMVALPHLYRVASCVIEDSGADFALVGVLSVGGDGADVLEGDAVASSRLVVRSWVAREFGMPKEGVDAFAAGVVSEYRGAQVPHVLCVEDFA